MGALLLAAAPSWADEPPGTSTDAEELLEASPYNAAAPSRSADGEETGSAQGETGTESAEPEGAETLTDAVDQASPSRIDGQGLSDDTRGEAMRAYHRALADRKLGPGEELSQQSIADRLAAAETKIAEGRRDEAIGDLVYLVESPRFDPFSELSAGRAALFSLGDALGRAGAYGPARGYLTRLLEGDELDVWYRRAVRTLVDLGLESDAAGVFLSDLKGVPDSAPAELRGDIAYLEGRSRQHRGDSAGALASFSRVSPRSRFWAQATYLAGLIEVERGRLAEGEQLFCKVADAKQTPKVALVFGGRDFFEVRDLARLALGRVAHETYRFDDARYYYYLVPNDSSRLPQALYESATGRYESKDYQAARDLIDELRALEVGHPYEDEIWVLDAYIDLALCEFASADEKLKKFLAGYEPVRDAARRLTHDERALRKLVTSVQDGADPANAGLGVEARVARALGSLLRLDEAYGRTARRRARLEHQMSGLRRAMVELDAAHRRLTSPKDLKPRSATELGHTESDELERVEAQLGEVRRLLREARRAKGARAELGELERQLEALELRARAARTQRRVTDEAKAKPDDNLAALVVADRRRATELYGRAQKSRERLVAEETALAKDALARLDARLSRLLRRARLGRIETVLGKKRSLEVEIEALSQGLLPRGAVDSLDAARYLRDDEEYWPYDGEDWADEYVGGEGLR